MMSDSRNIFSKCTSLVHVCGSAAFGLSLAIALCTLQNPVETKAQIVVQPVTAPTMIAYIPAPLTAREQRRKTARLMWKAVHQRAMLMRRRVTATLMLPDGTVAGVWEVALGEHPSWVTYDMSGIKPVASLKVDRIASSLTKESPVPLPAPTHCQLQGLSTDDQEVLRAETSCIAKSGYEYDPDKLAGQLQQALTAGATGTTLAVRAVPGKIIDGGKFGIGDVAMLSTGRSNFKGSGEGRKLNVRKALDEHINNVVVPNGAEFSFNDVLGGPVTQSAGWSMALTIFDGSRLEMAPGGGICQTSSTVYRAALKAGLPITEHKSHSLYVSYYEAYGVGQDATVYPGKQDFKFTNDTGAPLVLQSYHDGEDAYVNILGRADGRAVTLDGPYFAKTAPDDLLVKNRRLRGNEIAWIRTVRGNDGTETSEVLTSRYNGVPQSLVAKWPAQTEQILHAASPDLVAENIKPSVTGSAGATPRR